MRYYTLSCPHCHISLVEGTGTYKIPQAFYPLFRCKYCGKLFYTGGNEYLTMPVEERIKLKWSFKLNDYIKQSLDRTNHKEYLQFLKNHGYTIYPITETDFLEYPEIDFKSYTNAPPSAEAIECLYFIGALIKE